MDTPLNFKHSKLQGSGREEIIKGRSQRVNWGLLPKTSESFYLPQNGWLCSKPITPRILQVLMDKASIEPMSVQVAVYWAQIVKWSINPPFSSMTLKYLVKALTHHIHLLNNNIFTKTGKLSIQECVTSWETSCLKSLQPFNN